MIDTSDTESAANRLLATIFEKTGGDPGRSVSMWAAGESLGFDRNTTENLSMELVSEGLLEVKSLSGGVSLTESGLARAQASAPPTGESGGSLSDFVQTLGKALPELSLSAALKSDLELDTEVLRIQLKRSTPLTPVVKAVLGEIKTRLKASGPGADALLKNLDSLTDTN